MRVAIVVSTLRAGGMERVAVNMANHWAARGWAPVIVTTSQQGRKPAFALGPGVVHRDSGYGALRDDELDPSTMRAVADAIDLSDEANHLLLTHVVIVGRLRRTLRSLRPDAIISFGDMTNLRAILAADGLRVPLVISERCDPHRNPLGKWEPLRRKFYPRADAIVTLTHDAAKYFANYECKVAVIPNFVSCGAPRQQSRRFRTLIAVARLVREKRLDIAIDAFANIKNDWQFDIYGEGPDKPRLQRAIKDDRITMKGHVDDVPAVLAEAELFAMTSSTEGFPNALCEAMACGVPAVAIDCGAGVREIVRDGVDGVLVRDAAGFAAALGRLMNDDGERSRLASRAPEVLDRFSAETIMKQWEELIA